MILRVGPLLAGLLLGAAPHIPAGWVASILAIAVLLGCVRNERGRGPIRISLVAGAAAGAIGGVVALGGAVSTGAAPVVWVVAQAVLFAAVAASGRRGSIAAPFAAALLIGWVRQVPSWPLPVDLVAIGQVGGPVFDAARLGGPLLVTGLGVVAGAALARAGVDASTRRWADIRPSVIGLAAVAALAAAGSMPSVSTLTQPVPAKALGGPDAGPVRLLGSLVAYGTDLTVFAGDRRDYPGLRRARDVGFPVYEIDAAGALPSPWARAAQDVGARLLVVDARRQAAALRTSVVSRDALRVEAASIGLPVLVVGPAAAPLQAYDASGRPRPGAVTVVPVGRHAVRRRPTSHLPYATLGDGTVLLIGLCTLALRRLRWPAAVAFNRSRVAWRGIETAAYAVAITGAGALMGILVTRGPSGHLIEHVDARISLHLYAAASAGGRDLASAVSRSAHPPLSWLLAIGGGAVWTAATGRRRLFIRLTVAALGAEALTGLLKILVARPGPSAGPNVTRLLSSFPSGHVTEAAAIATVVAAAAWSRPWASTIRGAAVTTMAAWVLAVGVARVYLQAHWASDTVAAVALGVAVGVVANRAVRPFAPHADQVRRSDSAPLLPASPASEAS